jgi:anti-sigma B factor antagonist
MSEIVPCATWPQVWPFRKQDKESRLKLTFKIRANDDVTVVYCEGRIAYRDEAAALSDRVADLLPHARQLVLELSAVEMIDSAGLGELVALHKWARACGSSIKLAAPTRRILDLLQLTNLVSIFEVHPTLEDAMLSFRGQTA